MNTGDILSDDSDKAFEDFGDLMKTVTTLTKKKSGKGAPKKKMILQDLSKTFGISFNTSKAKNFSPEK